ncbi:MAG: hypothetical protein AAF479_07135 [Pseudomonadota bacterium]
MAVTRHSVGNHWRAWNMARARYGEALALGALEGRFAGHGS